MNEMITDEIMTDYENSENENSDSTEIMLCNTEEEFIFDLATKDVNILEKMPLTILENYELMLCIITNTKDPDIIKYLPDKLYNKYFIIEYISDESRVKGFKHLHKKYRNDKNIIEKALGYTHNPKHVIKYINEDLYNDRQFIKRICMIHGYNLLKYINISSLKNDFRFIINLIEDICLVENKTISKDLRIVLKFMNKSFLKDIRIVNTILNIEGISNPENRINWVISILWMDRNISHNFEIACKVTQIIIDAYNINNHHFEYKHALYIYWKSLDNLDFIFLLRYYKKFKKYFTFKNIIRIKLTESIKLFVKKERKTRIRNYVMKIFLELYTEVKYRPKNSGYYEAKLDYISNSTI